MTTMKAFFLLAAILTLSLATAPVRAADFVMDEVEPRVIVAPGPGWQTIDVQAWPGRSRYRMGEDVSLSVRVSRTSHVWILSTDGTGVTRQIFPNPTDSNNLLRAGQLLRIPRSSYRLVASAPGWDTIHVMAVAADYSWQPPHLLRRQSERDPFPEIRGGAPSAKSELRDAVEKQQPRTGGAEHRRGISPVPEFGELPPHDPYRGGPHAIVVPDRPHAPLSYHRAWGETRVQFYVDPPRPWDGDQWMPGPGFPQPDPWAPRPPASRDGALRIQSSPSGADVYIDGSYAGRTPLRFEMAAGNYSVEIFRPGYRPYTNDRVRVNPRQTRSMNVRLRR